MKDKICFVCIGQAGGNLGELLAEQGYNVLAINTSQEDLNTLKVVTHKYHVPGGIGCSKDRKEAKRVLDAHIEAIVDQIDNYCSEEIIYCIFSAGGGTGSGFSPDLIDALIGMYVDDDGYACKKIGAITILPADSESPQAKMNAYQCLEELSELEECMCNLFILDNNRTQNLKTLNSQFVDMITATLSVPSKHKSASGNVDTAEMIRMFTTPGVSVISVTSGKTDDRKIIEKIRYGIFAPINDSPEAKSMSYMMASTITPLNYKMFIAEFGQYVDEFHTSNQNLNIVMLNGLAFPSDRLSSMYTNLKQSTEIIRSNRQRRSSTKKMSQDSSILDDLVVQPRAHVKTEQLNGNSRRAELLSKLKRH